MNKPKRRFHSLLLCVESKATLNLLTANLSFTSRAFVNRASTEQKVTFLSMVVATDGLKYVFVTITNEGVLLFSKQFDAMNGDLPVVSGEGNFHVAELIPKELAVAK